MLSLVGGMDVSHGRHNRPQEAGEFPDVPDTGVGISSDLLPNIFDLFTQANRTLDRAQGGLGIGLTLVKKIVKMHRGTAEAKSAGPGQGSECSLAGADLPTALGIETIKNGPAIRLNDKAALRNNEMG
jgi:hypothetical protein